jgi:hypothetical protein
LRRPSPRWDNRSFAEKTLIIPILALGAEKSFDDQQAAILREVETLRSERQPECDRASSADE